MSASATAASPSPLPTNAEESATIQFAVIASFLGFSAATLAAPATQAAVAATRQSAKEKMQRLSKTQFADLATDVSDEIRRRVENAAEVPFLPVSEAFLPKRNQARQKLATLPTPKFKELATDIFWDLERRFPSAAEAYVGGPFAGASGRKGSAASSFAPPPQEKDNGVRAVEGVSPETVERLRSEYENRIEALQNRMVQMEKDFRTSKEEQQRSYELVITEQGAKLTELEAAHTKLKDEHAKLQNKFDALQDDYSTQQQIASDIRTEATSLLEEIKSLTQKNEELTAQLNAKNRANGIGGVNPEALAAIHASGVLDKSRLQAYYDAVDTLLQASRSKTPTSVLVAMKAIVISCKNITEDAELYESNNPLADNMRDALEDTKNNLSVRLGELMAAAKGHATNYGSVPAGVLEGAVDGLTAVVGDLVRLLKDAVTSTSAVGNVAAGGAYDIDQLKDYLEKQTDLIVQAIQSLLNSMRQNQTFGPDFTATVNQIIDIVASICQVSAGTMAKPSAASVRQRGNEILADLKDSSSKIGELGNALVASPGSKALKQRIASSSYEIAKFVKELIGLIEQ
ncbi:hypothetical protein BCR33DRAFT_721394 [Rhizoclosmatium globosum]|uniref:GIT Spa2 homology (SHD) domain-containing protein n=1 Tax=Rhizoclosmatium globosum TaxID=329046 RepID=A0A1Y2BU80_9FUNG|nr:hypothetical protein BCR33DRAFT_721394 [Rhizoclosmatium globosum]|eukprot:ORY37675.1 hypothetical protein BCR33DRAFT_721394 [Rhizoclosmatium globosum]